MKGKLREAKVGLVVDSTYFAQRATRAADILKTLMASKGLNAFTVDVATERLPPNAVRVIFVVNEGTGNR